MTLTWVPLSSGSSGNYLSVDPYSSANALVVNCNGRVSIGTTTPVAPFQVATQTSYTWGAGTLDTIYRLRTDSGATETGTAPITYSVMSAMFNRYIGASAMVIRSDHRLKEDIKPVPIERVRGLYNEIEVKSYRWKAHPDKQPVLGLIAQDLLERGFIDLVAQTPNDDLELQHSSDPYLEPVGIQLSADYPKLTCYNMRMIQHLAQEIEDLKRKISEL
ncbi:Intramolecular chaperone auto-processing domain [Phytophthora cactorum]|nr:Intramolecular chaperone auto-processing domain [Phytophthora cactorum]